MHRALEAPFEHIVRRVNFDFPNSMFGMRNCENRELINRCVARKEICLVPFSKQFLFRASAVNRLHQHYHEISGVLLSRFDECSFAVDQARTGRRNSLWNLIKMM